MNKREEYVNCYLDAKRLSTVSLEIALQQRRALKPIVVKAYETVLMERAFVRA